MYTVNTEIAINTSDTESFLKAVNVSYKNTTGLTVFWQLLHTSLIELQWQMSFGETIG